MPTIKYVRTLLWKITCNMLSFAGISKSGLTVPALQLIVGRSGQAERRQAGKRTTLVRFSALALLSLQKLWFMDTVF